MRRISSGRNSFLAATSVVAAALIFLGFATADAVGAPRVLGPGSATDQPQLEVVSQSATGMRVDFVLPALVVEETQFDGETFQSVTIPGGADAGDLGSPALPRYGRFVLVPDRAGVTISATVVEEEEVSGYRLAPVQDGSGTGFAYDATAYARVGYGTEPRVQTGEPAMLRDLRVVPMSFAPVQYDPSRGTLRIARRITVDVNYAGEDLRNTPTAPPQPVAPSFDKLYRQLVIGYDGQSKAQGFQHGTYLVICPNDQGVVDRLQPLLTWRRQQGFPVHVATTAETGTTAAQILNYIQIAYNSWTPRPEYIVLVGDAGGAYPIPTFHENLSGESGEGDHPYTLLAGGDVLSDAHVGRLSISSYTELETIVNKTVSYETAPDLNDAGWFTRACLVGDPLHSGQSTIGVMQLIKTRLLQVGYTDIDTVFGGSYVSQMTTDLNLGDSFFSYRGYWGFSGWQNSNTAALTNNNKVSYAVISTCGTGSFASGTSNSEAFLRAGTPTIPRGAIGAIGTATLGTATRYNNCFTLGVAHGLFYEDLWEMGASHTRGKDELYVNYRIGDPDAVTIFSYWNNLMGDPACPVWTAYPQALAAEYPASLPIGAQSVTVRVTVGGQPCPDATVCAYRPSGPGAEVQAVAVTDAAGYVTLTFPAAEAGTFKVTATKHDFLPARGDLPVTAATVFVDYLSSIIDDDNAGDSHGNANAQLNPGETIELGVSLQNHGSVPAADVTATLSSVDPYVTILHPTQGFGTINGGGNAAGQGPFLFSVSPSCQHGHTIRLVLDVVSGANQWSSVVDLPVVSADLTGPGITLYNAGNGILDPGEALQASWRVRNMGGAPASGVSGIMSSLSPWVTVVDAGGTYPDIPPGGAGENTTDRFTISAAPNTYAGHLAVFRLVNYFNSGCSDTSYASLTVGTRSSVDPVGPDHYGYYCFDNTDTGYPEAPTYNWIEINPALGGSGNQITLGDYAHYSDKSRSMDLPFPFTFYGQSFTRATICSNGWLSMGDTYLTEYRNWSIPGAGAPQNMIAAFWDDLLEYNSNPTGHVFEQYDAVNHRWIVEWSRMRNLDNSATETFEAILYDPAYHPTQTGDGIIDIQYNTVSNVDFTDGYSTVGIQNETQTDGVLYSYYNAYPAGAAPLAAGRAIRFRPATIDLTAAPTAQAAAPALRLEAAHPNPFTHSATVSFALPGSGQARLAVYDVQGRAVRTLFEGVLPGGAHTMTWDGRDSHGRDLPAGAYFYRLENGGRTLVRKFLRVQ